MEKSETESYLIPLIRSRINSGDKSMTRVVIWITLHVKVIISTHKYFQMERATVNTVPSTRAKLKASDKYLSTGLRDTLIF